MADIAVNLRINADGKVAVQVVNQVAEASQRMGERARQGGQNAAQGMGTASAATARLSSFAEDAKNQLVKLVAVAGGAVAVLRGVVSAADAWANLSARIQLATKTKEAYAIAEAEVFAISQRTSTQVDATATLYTKLSNSMSGTATTQRELLALTETINQAFALSGASSVDQANAIRQLSQAFAGGVLRAEEYNSVVEQGERLSRALAAGLGLTAGELRKQVNDGTVTVDRMVAALKNQANAIRSEFDQLPLTIGRAWTQLENTVLKTVGEMAKTTGAATLIASSLVVLGSNLNVVVVALLAFAAARVAAMAQAALQDAVQRRVAASALAEAEAQVAKARANVLVGGSTAALTSAEIRLAAAQEAATAAGVGKLGLLSRMGSGLLSLAGGPIGVAMLAIGGLAAAMQAISNAEAERVRQFNAGVKATNDAAQSIDGLVAQIERAKQHYDQLPDFATMAREWTNATEQLAAAQANLNAKRAEMEALEARVAYAQQSNAEGAGTALLSLVPKLEQLKGEYTALDDVVTRLSGSLKNLNFDAVFNPTASQVAGDQASQALALLTAEAKKSAAEFEKAKRGQIGYWTELANTRVAAARAAGATTTQIAAIQAENEALLKTIGSTMKKEAADRSAEKAGADLVAKLKEEVAVYGLTGTAIDRYRLAQAKVTPALRSQGEAAIALREAWDRYAKTLKPAVEAMEKINAGSADLDAELAKGRDVLAGLDDAQVQYNESVRESITLYEAALALGPPTQKMQEAEEARLRKLADLRDQRRAIDAHQERTRAMLDAERQQLQRSQQMWGDYADAIFDAVTRSGNTLKRLLSNLRDIVTRMLAEWFRTRVIGMFTGGGNRGGGSGGTWWGAALNSVFGSGGGSAGAGGGSAGASGGGNVWGAALGAGMSYVSGGGGDGGGSNLFTSALTSIAGNYVQNYFFGSGATSLAGNAAAGGIDLSAAAGNAYSLQANTAAGGINLSASAGAAQPYGTMGAYGSAAAWGGGVLGAYYGATHASDGQFHNRVGAGVTYGALGMGVAGTAAGVAGGASLGAAAGGAYAAIGSASWIPIVGWILALVAALDMGSGGKVFGTKWKPDTITQSIGIQDQAAYANIHILDKKYGSARFFAAPGDALGRARWRGRDEEATPEMQAAAEAIFRTASSTMRTAAAQLQIEVPPLIEGYWEAVSKYTRKGNLKYTDEMSVFFGVKYEESFEQFQKRLNAEQLIGAVEAAGGAAHEVAEQWRRDADLLLDGASMLLAAQVDLVKGRALLSEKYTLADVTELVQANQVGEESLLETYVRLQESTMIFEDALAILGQQLNLGRVAFVQFSADIAEAAGGVDQARALWADYFKEFFGQQQLLLRQRDTMQVDVGAQLTAIGLAPDASLADFREQFERVLPKLSPQEIVQWLEAGRALGTLAELSSRAGVATDLLTASLHTMGLTLDLSAQQFETFAAQIADAAGGLDEANKLWTAFFQAFYSEGELLGQQVALMRTNIDDQLVGLGLDTDISMADFRERFERALPKLSAEDIVRWLQAGNALAQLTNAQAQLQQQVAQVLGPMGLAGRALSQFGQALVAIHTQESAAIQAANALARSRGAEGASAIQVAAIHHWAMQQIGAAARQLKAEITRLVSDLYRGVPGSLDLINQRISELETASQATAGGINDIADAGANLFEQWANGIKSVQDYLDSMLFGDLSPLNPEQQIEEARRQLLDAQAAAMGGDTEALSQLPQLAELYLRLQRGALTSGGDFNAQSEWVRQLLQSVVGMANPYGRPNGSGGDTYTVGPSAELVALYAARDAALAEQYAEQRRQLAEQLVQHLGDFAALFRVPIFDLIQAQGVNLRDLATDLGVNLSDLTAASVEVLGYMATTLGVSMTELTQNLGIQLADLGSGLTELTQSLGIDLSALTVESTQSLAALAASLGMNLAELSAAVGINLGDLTDRQSLLNQALAGTIDQLPGAQRDQLRPLLEAITDATNEADANAAIGNLRDAVTALSPDLRNQLAPFFEGIVPSSALTQLDYLGDIQSIASNQLDVLVWINDMLGAINANVAAANASAGIPSYAVGTGFVDGDQLANIHHGEAVVPAAVNAWFRDANWQLPRASSNDDSRVVAALARIEDRLDALERSNTAGHVRTAQTIDAGDAKARQQRDETNRALRDGSTNRSNRYG